MATVKSFESALKSLEEAVESLEREDLGLEESLQRFEVGVKSVALCQQLLRQVETRVEQLVQDPSGDFSLRPFTAD